MIFQTNNAVHGLKLYLNMNSFTQKGRVTKLFLVDLWNFRLVHHMGHFYRRYEVCLRVLEATGIFFFFALT